MQNESKTKVFTPRQRFKELRALKGTQRKVADDLGVTETTIRAIEAGRFKPSVSNLIVFADYFETDVYDLWPEIVEEARATRK